MHGDENRKEARTAMPDRCLGVASGPIEWRTIGWAVKQMHGGQAVRRRGWNGRGMFVKLQVPDDHSKMSLPYVFMRTAQGDLVPWLCSQTDLLATDWEF